MEKGQDLSSSSQIPEPSIPSQSSQESQNSPPKGKEEEAPLELREEYDLFCNKLNVDVNTLNKGYELLTAIPSDQTPSQWMGCALYVASKRNGGGNSIQLSSILKEASMSLVDFFDKMKVFINLTGLDSTHEEQLVQLKRKWIVLTCLYHKYENIYGEVLILPSVNERNPNFKGERSESFHLFSFGWLLFLVVKGRLLSTPPDFVNAFHMLLCCINLLFVHVPESQRKISLKDPSIIASNEASGAATEYTSTVPPIASPEGVNNLPYLCTIFKANFNEVMEVHNRLFGPFIKMYAKNNILKFTHVERNNIFYLDHLLEHDNTIRNKNSMNKEYELMYFSTGDVDERQYITQNEQIGTPSRNSSNLSVFTPNTRPESFTPFRDSHNAHNGVPQTPVTQTMDMVQWLHLTVSNQSDTPNANLKRFFSVVGESVNNKIEERVSQFSALLKHEDGMEVSRQTSGIKLYYKVLENLLVSEESRLKSDNFSSLLNHGSFHQSLLACCFEIVAFIYKLDRLQFPSIINRFGLLAFEYCKIIENVVRNIPDLPKGIVAHLVRTEEVILESLAWQENSPLYSLLPSDANQRESFHNHLLASSMGVSLRTGISALASPMRPPSAHSEMSSPGGKPIRRNYSSTLEHFYKKLILLAGGRYKDLCTKLSVAAKVQVDIWQTILHVLVQSPDLMKNRHLDQIIITSIYGVCKVYKIPEITFRVIIDAYKTQPQYNSRVVREVKMEDGEKKDIIAFYNTSFLPSMEKTLTEFPSGGRGAEADNVPATVPFQTVAPSPQKVSNKANLYLSPMKSKGRGISGVSTPVLHHSSSISSLGSNSTIKISLGVGESPSKGLTAINQRFNSPQSKKSRKRLNFDGMESPEVPAFKRKFEEDEEEGQE
eukprot:TRINITY_DN5718_c0_g1_i4.p1 TRINITY_DN5718_c0_g1~~TRINITY_DN5718_c0_g1_i4.p1  ORF type:complete len:886 (+),score=280.19 TRINITY_DN5718_c0_g1_i4:164-2821(+)